MTTALDVATTQLTGTYELDPDHTHIGFVARHAMVAKVRGEFTDFAGTLHLDGPDPTSSSASVTIRAASVDTSSSDRDAHLRSGDFLDVETHPEITFTSTEIEPGGDTTFRVTGDLTIRDVTRPVTFDVEFTGAATDPFGNERVGFEGAVTVNRTDWGLTWNAALEAGGVLVGEKVTLELEVSAIRAA